MPSGTARPASDLDLLVVTDPLPPSRMKRVREFRPVDDATRAARSGAWSDVVRESQDLVELALKGMLRWAGIDPPKIHDVGDLVLQFADRLANIGGQDLAALAEDSKELRKEREFSLYGDIDFIPTDDYDREDAENALAQARLAEGCLGRLIGG